MATTRLANRTALNATLLERRAIVYLTVDWAIQERRSRETFSRFVDQIERDHPHLGVTFWVLGEECEGQSDWFEILKLMGPTAKGGYGAVVWLAHGEVRDVVEDAAAVGVGGLVGRTIGIWDA